MQDNQVLDLEKKLDIYQKENRDNFSKIFDDMNDRADKQDDIYRKIDALRSEFELFKDEIQKHTKVVKAEAKETKEAIAGGMEAIEESLIGKTKIVEKKIIEHFDILRPIRRLFKREGG